MAVAGTYSGANRTGLLDYELADDDVASQVAKAADTSSPLIQKARQDGIETANSRGLLNTSIAAGASTAEAYKVALPIGQQAAAQNFQKNRSNQDFEQTGELNKVQNKATSDLSAQEFGQTTQLNTQQNTQQTRIAQMGIDAQAQQQAAQILADVDKQARQLASDSDLALLRSNTEKLISQMGIDDAQRRQLLEIANEQIMQARQIGASTYQAELQARTQTTISQMGIDAQAQQQARQIVADAAKLASQLRSDADIAALARETQVRISQMGIDDAQKRQIMQIASEEIQQARNIASTEAISGQDQATKIALGQMDVDSRERIANMNVVANQQDKATAAALRSAEIYGSMANAIAANSNIPADARTSLMENTKALFDRNLGLVEQFYNIDLDWGTAAPAAATGGAPATSYGGTDANGQPVDQGGWGGGGLLDGVIADMGSGGGGNAGFGDGQGYPTDWNVVAYTDQGGIQYNSAGVEIGRI